MKIALSASYYKHPAVKELLHSCDLIFSSQTFNTEDLVNTFGSEKVYIDSLLANDHVYENKLREYLTEKYSDEPEIKIITRLTLIETKEEYDKQKNISELTNPKPSLEGLLCYEGLKNLKRFLLGMRVSTNHPVTPLNPAKEFLVVEVKNEDQHIYVRGQNTMYFELGQINNLMKFENVDYKTKGFIEAVIDDVKRIHIEASDKLGKVNSQKNHKTLLRVVEITEAIMDGFKLLDQHNVWSPDYKYDGDMLKQKMNNTLAQLHKTLSTIN